MDIVSPKIRSRIMARVKSRGNRSTEKRFRAYLIRSRVKGWRSNAKDIPGTPDIFFDKKRLAIFIDGCFWHGCPKCYRRPKSKRKFWDEKVVENRMRDKKVNRKLKSRGIKVVRIFECLLQKESVDTIINKIRK